MLSLMLKENFFTFNGKHYLETHRTAMGTKTAVSLANIFMAYTETTTLSKTVFKPTVWKCYIDDIFPYANYRILTSDAFLNQKPSKEDS